MILVTGAAGLIGGYLCTRLEHEGILFVGSTCAMVRPKMCATAMGSRPRCRV